MGYNETEPTMDTSGFVQRVDPWISGSILDLWSKQWELELASLFSWPARFRVCS